MFLEGVIRVMSVVSRGARCLGASGYALSFPLALLPSVLPPGYGGMREDAADNTEWKSQLLAFFLTRLDIKCKRHPGIAISSQTRIAASRTCPRRTTRCLPSCSV